MGKSNAINRMISGWNVSSENAKQNNCQIKGYRSRKERSLEVQKSKLNLKNK